VKNKALINTPMSFYIDFMGCHMFGQRACPTGWKITRWPASLETCSGWKKTISVDDLGIEG
jgi:hypothetical protein